MIYATSFAKGFRCPTFLFLDQYEDYSSIEINDLDRSHEILKIYLELFIGGVETKGHSLIEKAKDTSRLIELGEHIILNPVFISDDQNFGFTADAIVSADKKLHLYTLKLDRSKTEPDDIFEAGIQYRVMKSLNLHKSLEIYFSYINKDYEYSDTIRLAEIFYHTRMTWNGRRNIPLADTLLFKYRNQFEKGRPNPIKNKMCKDPIDCKFYNGCWNKDDQVDLYKIENTLPHRNKEFEIQNSKVIKGIYINYRKLSHFFASASSSTQFFLRMRSEKVILPMTFGMKPFDHLPYQFTLLHNNSGSVKTYQSFYDTGDWRKAFAKSFVESTVGDGNIFVWEDDYIYDRLCELQRYCPEYEKELDERMDRIVDLKFLLSKNVITASRITSLMDLRQVFCEEPFPADHFEPMRLNQLQSLPLPEKNKMKKLISTIQLEETVAMAELYEYLKSQLKEHANKLVTT